MSNASIAPAEGQVLLGQLRSAVHGVADLPGVAGFIDGLDAEPDGWMDRAAQSLPAAATLRAAASEPSSPFAGLLRAFVERESTLHWEQSYTAADALVGEDMLAGYGFVEILGSRGPLVSSRSRSGIGVWGPHIDYPRHWHDAEEIYLVVSGSARFTLGDAAPFVARTGEAVHVTSGVPHGFCTEDEHLVVLYLWQAGDLRQTSRFG